jgi:pilus assembly protein Flp/PilA
MRNLVSRFVKNDEGAALVEYGLLVGLIAVVCITAVTLLGNQINTVFTDITTDLTAAGIKG